MLNGEPASNFAGDNQLHFRWAAGLDQVAGYLQVIISSASGGLQA